MLITLIILCIALIFIILKLNIFAIFCLCISFIFLLFYYRKSKNNIIIEKTINEHMLTSNVLKMHQLSVLIDSGLLSGDFLVSKVFISKLMKTENQNALNTDYSFENIEYLKRKGILKEIAIEDNITQYFKYAFENLCTIIITKEKAASNLFKIFKVKNINLESLKIENSKLMPGKNIHYIITKKNKNKYEGYFTNSTKVFVSSNKNLSYGINYGKIQNVLEINNDITIIMEDINDN